MGLASKFAPDSTIFAPIFQVQNFYQSPTKKEDDFLPKLSHLAPFYLQLFTFCQVIFSPHLAPIVYTRARP